MWNETTPFPVGWYPLCHADEVPNERPKGLLRMERWVVVWRTAAGIHVAEDRCPHRGARLSLGAVENERLVCPFHGFAFDDEGACTLMPHLGKPAPGLRLETSSAVEHQDLVWVWFGPTAPTTEPPKFGWLPQGGRRTLVAETWDVSIDLAVENQLDHQHLPVVHPDTVGRHVALDARAEVSDLSPERVRSSFADGGFAEFIWPALWGTRVMPKLGITIAFSPVHRQRTRLYLQGHRGFALAPIVRRLVDAGMRRFHRKALSQDRPIVASQASWPPDGDQLYRPDEAIRWYRERLAAANYRRPAPRSPHDHANHPE